jgi:hypothetical protein
MEVGLRIHRADAHPAVVEDLHVCRGWAGEREPAWPEDRVDIGDRRQFAPVIEHHAPVGRREVDRPIPQDQLGAEVRPVVVQQDVRVRVGDGEHLGGQVPADAHLPVVGDIDPARRERVRRAGDQLPRGEREPLHGDLEPAIVVERPRDGAEIEFNMEDTVRDLHGGALGSESRSTHRGGEQLEHHGVGSLCGSAVVGEAALVGDRGLAGRGRGSMDPDPGEDDCCDQSPASHLTAPFEKRPCRRSFSVVKEDPGTQPDGGRSDRC